MHKISKADWDKVARIMSSLVGVPLWAITTKKSYSRHIPYLDLDSSSSMLELGSSTGICSRFLAKKFGVRRITLVDRSEYALRLAVVNSDDDVELTCINQDIFDLNLQERFDLVHSEGLLEHFSRADAKRLFKRHLELVRPGGYLLITVPTPTFRYRLSRKALELTHTWIFGYEKPFIEQELVALFEEAGVEILSKVKTWHNIGILGRRPQ